MEETISLQDLFKTVKKRLSLIVLITVVAITLSGMVSFLFLTPIYSSSTQILVNQTSEEANGQINTQDIQANLQLINTYSGIIKSPAILSKVIEEIDLKITPSSLNSAVTVNVVQNSQILAISVQNSNQVKAAEIANTIATVFQEEIVTLMNVDNVNILAPAEIPEKPSPIKPNPKLNMALAAVVGLMLGIGIAFLLEYLDTTMKTEQDIEDILGLPILGLISPIADADVKTGQTEVVPRRRRG